MKYYLLMTDTTILYAGVVLNEKGLDKLKALCPRQDIVVDDTDYSSSFIQAYEFGPDANDGERNTFHMANGDSVNN